MTAHRFIETHQSNFRPLLSSGGSVGKVKPPTRDGMGNVHLALCSDKGTLT